MSPPADAIPLPLRTAAALVAAEGVVLVGLAGVELVALDGARVTMGVTTTLFFAAYGVGLIAVARGAWCARSWSRAPAVLTQLIQLGVAWSFRGGDTTLIALVVAAVAVLTLVGLFHPASTVLLSREA